MAGDENPNPPTRSGRAVEIGFKVVVAALLLAGVSLLVDLMVAGRWFDAALTVVVFVLVAAAYQLQVRTRPTTDGFSAGR